MKKVTNIILATSLALSLGSMAIAADVNGSNHETNALNGLKFTLGAGVGGGLDISKVPEGINFAGAGANAKLKLGTALFTTTPNSTLGFQASVGVGAYSMKEAFVPQYFVNLDFVQAFDVGDGFIKLGYIIGAGLAVRTNDNNINSGSGNFIANGSTIVGAASLQELASALPNLQIQLDQARQRQQSAQNAFNSAQGNVNSINANINNLQNNLASARAGRLASPSVGPGSDRASDRLSANTNRINRQIAQAQSQLSTANNSLASAQSALNQANFNLSNAQNAFNGNRTAQVSQATQDINSVAGEVSTLVNQANSALNNGNNISLASSSLARALQVVNSANNPKQIGQSLVSQGIGDTNAFNQSLTNLQNAQASLATVSQRVVDAQNRPTPPTGTLAGGGNTNTGNTNSGNTNTGTGNTSGGTGGTVSGGGLNNGGFGNTIVPASNADTLNNLAALIAYLNSIRNARIAGAEQAQAARTSAARAANAATILPTLKAGIIAFIGQNQSISLEYQYYFRNKNDMIASSDITLNYTYYFGKSH
ncbi:hypothetical protein BKH43_00095 [Helicobacter sp. 13S00401-1]|uniref:hypothetical protein n=1 Tax=Helicobacter sp. 13S00401-1 TaxID=1905758 RepID=UPI000BA5C289|nr:hypothetical protein [Helicobacter sp. 13S00401-1]PAF51679.1 hypothetical protein BKH43_00095 [Helicobacter sp. 13S00401-1]